MNRSKQSIFNKLRKSMTKAIKQARNKLLSAESIKDRDSLTARELQKKFPKKPSRKKEELAKALARRKAKSARAAARKADLDPLRKAGSLGYTHREGTRSIKNSKNKIKDQRNIAAHHGGIKK